MNRTRHVWTVAILIPVSLLAGCTRFKPVTNPRAETAPLPDLVRGKPVLAVVDHDAVDVAGGHHDGLIQTPQVWIFGLSDDQKKTLYSNAGLLSTVAILGELKHQGLAMDVVKNGDPPPPVDDEFLLMITVEKIRLDTYGSWFAGNYWDAEVRVKVLFSSRRTGNSLWMAEFEEYAKLEPCPAKLDWADLIQKQVLLYAPIPSISGVAGVAKLQRFKDLLDYRSFLDSFSATYTLRQDQLSPVEVASRAVAKDILSKIASTDPTIVIRASAAPR